MGSSGAGKTTLLDCLAQRKDEGILRGEVLMCVATTLGDLFCQDLTLSLQQRAAIAPLVPAHHRLCGAGRYVALRFKSLFYD